MTTSGAPPWSLLAHDHDADALAAMPDRGIHRKPLRRRMLAGDHHVDVVAAAQAVIHHDSRQLASGGRYTRTILGLLVHDVIDETGILVGEAVVILAPDM
jgi:hypothetical protein